MQTQIIQSHAPSHSHFLNNWHKKCSSDKPFVGINKRKNRFAIHSPLIFEILVWIKS